MTDVDQSIALGDICRNGTSESVVHFKIIYAKTALRSTLCCLGGSYLKMH